LSRRGSRVRVPSAAPYSVTWNAERQVTTEKPAHAGFFLSVDCPLFLQVASFHRFSDLFEK
ncbi:hypothetical protein SB725_30410, partial [Pseudomonas sp. SIMBA_041]|uniref:hypothetical protein n=1 Tax=Pseudomonas sp. SIMBA_041 TaxID=3085782 RepID=UPI00397DFEC0